MALQGKPVAIGNTATTIYTCPGGTEAAVHGLIFANNTGGALTVDLAFYDQTTGTTVTVATDLSVAANSYITWAKPINMNAGDYIQATSSASSGLVCLFSAYEGSAAPVATGFTARGVWSSASTYAINDIVTVVGTGTYLAIQASTNQNPTSATAYWMFLEGISASALPSQAGQAGKYLTTDGTDASWAALDVAGGGTVTDPMSSNVTLTSASTRVQIFSPNTNRTITLPAASSLSEGESFVLINKGSSSISVNNNAGTFLSAIQPGKGLKFFLADQATSDWEAFSAETSGALAPTISRNISLRYSSTALYNTTSLKLSTNKYAVMSSGYGGYSAYEHAGEIFTFDNDNVYTSLNTSHAAFNYANHGYGHLNGVCHIDSTVFVHNGYTESAPNYPGRTTCVEHSESVSAVVRHSHTGPSNTDGQYYSGPVAKVSTRKVITFYVSYSGLTTASHLSISTHVIDYSSSLTSPTVGSVVNFATGGTHAPSGADADRLEDNKGILFYNQRNGTTAPSFSKRAVVWSVSGTTPSFGSSIEISTAINNAHCRIRSISSSKAVVFWMANDGTAQAKILSVSGTTITAGSQFQLTNTIFNNNSVSLIAGENGDTFYAVAQNPGDNNSFYMSKFVVSGTSISSQTAYSKISAVIPVSYQGSSISGFYDSEKEAMIVFTGGPASGPVFISIVKPTAM